MWNNKKQQKVAFLNVTFTKLLLFSTKFQKVDQQTGGKWLVLQILQIAHYWNNIRSGFEILSDFDLTPVLHSIPLCFRSDAAECQCGFRDWH